MIGTAVKATAIMLALFGLANLAFACIAGYFVAAGADEVWHGMELPAMAEYAAGVAFVSGIVAFLCFPAYIIATDEY